MHSYVRVHAQFKWPYIIVNSAKTAPDPVVKLIYLNCRYAHCDLTANHTVGGIEVYILVIPPKWVILSELLFLCRQCDYFHVRVANPRVVNSGMTEKTSGCELREYAED